MSRALDDILDAHQDVDAALTALTVDRRRIHLDRAWTACRTLLLAIRRATKDPGMAMEPMQQKNALLKLKP